jgi:nickel-dependent lactate racemase
MLTKLRYGADAELTLDLPAESVLAVCNAPRGDAQPDAFAAVKRAIEEPLEFPPLARSVVPGDRVALALAAGVPKAAETVAAIVEQLLAGGVSAEDITIVRTIEEKAATPDPRSQLGEDVRQQVKLETHDPHDRNRLSYLAASSDANPIYLNRTISEADLVVSVGISRLKDSLAYTGPASGMFAIFSDAQTAERYRAPRLIDSAARRRKLQALAEEASWLLGVPFVVQIVPGAANQILHVVAGRDHETFARAAELCEAAWNFTVPYRASVVVAAVEGANGCQTWENVARALNAASHAVSDDGAIAICSELAEELGPALQQLSAAEDVHQVLREIGKQRPIDAIAAAELAHAIERGPVYLLSRLGESTVEELGIANVASEADLARLVARHDTCILLANAQHAVASVEDEPI